MFEKTTVCYIILLNCIIVGMLKDRDYIILIVCSGFSIQSDLQWLHIAVLKCIKIIFVQIHGKSGWSGGY